MGATEVIAIIVEAIQEFLSGIGSSIVSFFEVLVWDATLSEGAGGLTTLGVWLLVFLGLSLAIGIARLVFAIFRTRR